MKKVAKKLTSNLWLGLTSGHYYQRGLNWLLKQLIELKIKMSLHRSSLGSCSSFCFFFKLLSCLFIFMCAQIKSKKNHTLFPKKKKIIIITWFVWFDSNCRICTDYCLPRPKFDSDNFKVCFCNCIRDRPAIWGGWARTNLIYRSQASYPPCVKPQLMNL